LRLACEVADVTLVQLPVNILGEDLEPEMRQLVHDKSIGVVAYNVLAYGLLTGKYGPDARFPENDRRSRLPLFQGDAYRQAIQQISEISAAAELEGLTCAQYSISKVVNRVEVASAILGIKSSRQIEENCAFLAENEFR